MPKTKKKFINRKEAVTFNLVHRSQRDPLAADESAPQRVLVPVNANIPAKKEKEPNLTPDQRREEQRKYGIYFDDDYNYLQHLKDTKEVTMVMAPKATHKKKDKPISTEGVSSVKEKLQLPSSVFASEVEEDVGLLNKAAPQGLCLDLDPDVVAALDDDFDHEDPDNELEDNFIELAMADGPSSEEDEHSEEDEASDDRSDRAFASDLDSDDDSGDSQGGPRKHKMPVWDPFEKEETRSRFTEYSMSSSVTQRNKGLTLLDNKFEKPTPSVSNDAREAENPGPSCSFNSIASPPSKQRKLGTRAKQNDEFSKASIISQENSPSDSDVNPVAMYWTGKLESLEPTQRVLAEHIITNVLLAAQLGNLSEKSMFAEYDDTELGPLDCEEIDGYMPHTHDMLLRAAEDFQKTQRYAPDKERIRRLQEIQEESSSDSDELVKMDVPSQQKWDCESILSTYSNLYNHPKLIEEPKKSKKIQIDSRTGIPKNTLGENKLTVKSLARFNALNKMADSDSSDDGMTNAESVLSTLSVLSIRPKNESGEDKKDRKRLLKEYRKERRIEKKANKEVFKEEKKRQEKIVLNNRNNVQGNKIY